MTRKIVGGAAVPLLVDKLRLLDSPSTSCHVLRCWCLFVGAAFVVVYVAVAVDRHQQHGLRQKVLP